jgi:hypothetical protein
MNIREYYGSEKEVEMIKTEPQVQTSISYRSKDVYEPIPAGAEITRKSVNISVSEIENGFIKSVDVEIYYRIKEDDGDWEDKYAYECKKYYSKEKPVDIELTYAV